ncbi:MAG: hypothetical protein PHH59_16145 [Methylovulum sp.]|uniref:hypothetical protein n=1 Tax=Methylovulum sp. TaxID=1916980 RepID=UPI002609879F|nr:hypothetical protein [Methylovulum sp.]MDD2725538.1 hypothetical protein [Methylovulum sp.]MDD5125813.1 hypothetical protein [Methylovulum sp.]
MKHFMAIFLIFSLAFFITPTYAEVFKCVIDDKTVYQPEPCPAAAVKQAEIVIEKPDPAKTAEAQAKLKAWENDFSQREVAERQAQKERQTELDRQAEIDALNRSAKAQEELAEEAKHPHIINRPYIVNPYFYPYQRPSGHGFDQHHHHDPDHQPQPPGQRHPLKFNPH